MSEATPMVQELLDVLPREPGVYLLKDVNGQVLYVGKAKSLHSRVRSYFTARHDDRAFVPLLGRLVRDIETIVTANEKEALLLENTLIKQHRPRFNVMLRDDKSYLVLRLDPEARFPRLEVARRIRDDGARYFGPYHSASDARQTLRLVNRHFQLRTCSDAVLARRRRPCLQHQIKRCLGPCVFPVDPAQYREQVEDVTLFLRGKGDELVRELERRMEQAATELDYERAARLRDQIAAVRNSLQGQQAVSDALEDRDVFGLHREGDQVEIVVLVVRAGKLIGRRPFAFREQEFPDDEVLSSFLARYYERGESVPPQLLVPVSLEDVDAKRQWLAELRGSGVEIVVPQRGGKRRLLELAQRNARASAVSRRLRAADVAETLAKLQRRLRMTRPPRRIECFDISSLQGRHAVASMVVFVDGEPRRSAYRRFRIVAGGRQAGAPDPERRKKARAAGGAAPRGQESTRSCLDQPIDDFAAMYEVLARRLRRARDRHAGWELPELIVVDGGKQQLAMALAALRDVGVHPDDAPPDMVALAKERGGAAPPDPGPLRRPQARAAREVAVPDRVFLPHVKDAVRLRPNTAELFLVARVRDEAHRFAVTYHRQLRRRRALRSGLEDIPGIGPRRRQELLRALGSLRRIHGATVEELAAVPGMSLQAAEAVAAYFARPKGRAEGAGEDQEENKEQGTGNRAQGTTTGE